MEYTESSKIIYEVSHSIKPVALLLKENKIDEAIKILDACEKKLLDYIIKKENEVKPI